MRKTLSYIKDLDVKGAGKLSRWLAPRLIPKPKGECIIDTIYDFKLKINPAIDNGVEKSLYYFGEYEKGTLYIIGELLEEGDCFVDIGANIGLMSIFAAQQVGENGSVIAFEPNPNTKKILQENIQLNDIQHVKVEELAVGSVSKNTKIYDALHINRGSASLIKPDVETDSYDIRQTTLSEYFTPNQAIKLIKIDIEGYELEALKGAEKVFAEMDKPPMLIVEFSSQRANTFGDDTSPLYKQLKDMNYRLFKSVRGKEKTSKLIEVNNEAQAPEHDNLYCFTDKHLNEISRKIFK